MTSKGFGLGAIGFGQLGGATPPGGNIKAIPYSQKWVQFPIDAVLQRSTTTIVDGNTITISGWFELPNGTQFNQAIGNPYYPVLEFGGFNAVRPPQSWDETWGWVNYGSPTWPMGFAGPIIIYQGGWITPAPPFYNSLPPDPVPPNFLTAWLGYTGDPFSGSVWQFTPSYNPNTGTPAPFATSRIVVTPPEDTNGGPLCLRVQLYGGAYYDIYGASSFMPYIEVETAPGSIILGQKHHFFITADLGPSGLMVNQSGPTNPGFPTHSNPWGLTASKANTMKVVLDLVPYGGTSVPGYALDSVQRQAITFGRSGAWDWYFGTLPPTPGAAIKVNQTTISLPSNQLASSNSIISDDYDGPAKIPKAYADVQIWFGTYIDPAANYGGGLQAKPTQANSQYGKVNPVLVGEVVQAAVAAGLDPLYVLTAMNIESAYGTQPGTVIFELDTAHVTDALGSGYGGQYSDNNNQMRAFVASNIAYKNQVIPSYIEVAIEFLGTDPTGVYSYLGQLGSVNQTNALSALTSQGGLSPATQIKNMPAPSNTALLGQAWSNQQSGITGNSTMAQWFSSLNALWATASADAALRLQGSSNANINAFVNANGGPVPTIVAAGLFGEPTVLFTGNAANFPFNVGSTQQTEPFTLIGGPLTNLP